MVAGMDRRRFLQVSAALTAGIALTACTTTPAEQQEPEASASAKPRTFRFAQAAQVLSLDPARTNRIESFRISAQVLEPLVQADSNTGEPVAGLAQRWSVSDDSLTYSFVLDSEAVFSDGSALTVEGVLANVERWKKLSGEPMSRTVQPYHQLFAPEAGSGKPLVTDWEADGEHGVKVTLSRASVSFLKALTQPSYRLVEPGSIGSDGYVTGTPVGTGPFVVESWDGSTAVLTAVAGHRAVATGVDRLEFVTVPSAEKRYYHLLKGEIDAYDQVALKDYVPLALDGYPVQSRDPYAVAYLALNLAHPAFKDARARRALAHAIDRGKLVGDYYPQGTATANDFVPALFQVKNEESGTVYRFDQTKAKELLRSSLYANQEINFYYPVEASIPALPSPEGIYATISANLVEAGFNIVPKPYRWADADSEDTFALHEDAGLELTGFVGDFRDPTAFLGRVLAPAASAPEHLSIVPSSSATEPGEATPSPTPSSVTDGMKVATSYAQIMQAIEQADSVESVDERRASYRDINASVSELLCAVPLAYPVSGVTSSKRVTGYVVNATCIDDFSEITVTS